MRTILIILLSTLCLHSWGQSVYYVAPADSGGNDSNAGTLNAPWATFQKAFDTADAGDTIYFRGGIYWSYDSNDLNPTSGHGNSGTQANPIHYFGYPSDVSNGDMPILDCHFHCDSGVSADRYNSAISIENVEYIKFKDLVVRNVYQCDSVIGSAIGSSWSANLTFENVTVYNVGQRVFTVNSGAFGDLYEPGITSQWEYDTTRFINCDVYNACDTFSYTPGNAADGWITSNYLDNVFIWEGCRGWDISDDIINTNGWGKRIINNCWLFGTNKWGDDFHHEGTGIKSTGIHTDFDSLYYNAYGDSLRTPTEPHLVVSNCIAVYMGGTGFAGNVQEQYIDLHNVWYNNTAYKCATGFTDTYYGGEMSWNTTDLSGWFRNNIAYGSTTITAGAGIPFNVYVRAPLVSPIGTYNASHNTWYYKGGYPCFYVSDSVTVTDQDFVYRDSATIESKLKAARKSDGSLPDDNPMRLHYTSDLIDAGMVIPASDSSGYTSTYYGASPDIGACEFVPIIADHSIVDEYDNIPQQWIDSVKTMWVTYAGESHAQWIDQGFPRLEAIDADFDANVTTIGTPEGTTSSHLRASKAKWGSYASSTGWDYTTGETDWYTNATAISRVKAGLTYANSIGNPHSAIGYGWCWDATEGDSSATTDPVYGVHWYGRSNGSPEGDRFWGIDDDDNTVTGNSVNMDSYLEATQSYIDYCADSISTAVFFTTGPVDVYEEGYIQEEALYQGHLKYEHIRDYVDQDASRILFDYADILCYDDTSTTYNTETWNGNTFPAITDNNANVQYAHISYDGTVRLAKAMWWMLARIAGWDGGEATLSASTPSAPETPSSSQRNNRPRTIGNKNISGRPVKFIEN